MPCSPNEASLLIRLHPEQIFKARLVARVRDRFFFADLAPEIEFSKRLIECAHPILRADFDKPDDLLPSTLPDGRPHGRICHKHFGGEDTLAAGFARKKSLRHNGRKGICKLRNNLRLLFRRESVYYAVDGF